MRRCLVLAALFVFGAGSIHAQDSEREMAAANFQQADADADGALTLEEFTTLINLNAEDDLGRAGMIKRAGLYETAFGRLDADGDGRVTVQEIISLAGES